MQADVPSQARPRRAETKQKKPRMLDARGICSVRFFRVFYVSAGCEPQRFSAVVAGLEPEVQE